MPTFHVHIGLPKTGSTTFQKALQINAGSLAPQLRVINRMQFGPQRQGLMRAHAYIRQNYASGIDTSTLAHHLETALEQPLSQVEQGQTVLITDEGLSGPHPGQFADHPGLFPALPAALEAMSELLPRDKTIFHIVTRDHKSWVKSLYNQAVKQTGYTDTPEAFSNALPTDCDITDHLHQIKQTHSDKDIRIHPMEGATLFPGQQILQACGISAQKIATLSVPEKVNKSWSKGMLRAMRVINGAAIDDKSKNILRKALSENRDVFRDT